MHTKTKLQTPIACATSLPIRAKVMSIMGQYVICEYRPKLIKYIDNYFISIDDVHYIL